MTEKWRDTEYADKVVHHSNRCKRYKATAIEIKVSLFLSENFIEFEKEKYFSGLGGFVDFYVPKYNIVIECDGAYWHGLPGAKERDERRDKFLLGVGINVLRLPEENINNDWDNVVAKILGVLHETEELSI